MDPLSAAEAGQAAYASVSQSMVFTGVALSFLGLTWALTLMLRPKTSVLCVWSMALFSIAWLTESTTHLLGMAGQAPLATLRYGVWAAVGLFGVGLIVGLLGVLAYLRNEHRYERGLLIGVVAGLANLWVVGGIASAYREHRTAALGCGLVIPVMPSGGPVESSARAQTGTAFLERESAKKVFKLGAMLGRAVSDLAVALSGKPSSAWELRSGSASDGPGVALVGHPVGSPAVLKALHPGAQHVLTTSSGAGWMSLGLIPTPEAVDAAESLAATNKNALEKHSLSLTPLRRLRATRTHLAGFEVIRISSEATIQGLAGAAFFDQWVAVAKGQALEVLACSQSPTPEFLDATNTMVTGVLRALQREGLSGPIPSELAQSQRAQAEKLERDNQLPEALALWQRIAAATPGDGEAFLDVVRCSWKLGKTKEALTWLESGATPAPGSVSTAVGDLRIRIATGQPKAREKLVERFDQGLEDDDALASLMLGFVTSDERAGALQALGKYGPRHAVATVAKWQAYLSEKPAAGDRAQAASSPTAAHPPSRSNAASTVVSRKSPARSPEAAPARVTTSRRP